MSGLETLLQALAQAEGGQPAADPMGGCLSMLPFFLIVFVIFYFLVIRPQKKEQQKQQRFLEMLKEGDRVITSSGIYGRIVNLDLESVTLDVGDRTKVRFARSHVARVQGEPQRREQAASASSSKDKSSEQSADGADGESKHKKRGE